MILHSLALKDWSDQLAVVVVLVMVTMVMVGLMGMA